MSEHSYDAEEMSKSDDPMESALGDWLKDQGLSGVTFVDNDPDED